MSKIVVTVEGGIVQSILFNEPDTEILLVDRDVEGADKDEEITLSEMKDFVKEEKYYGTQIYSGVSELEIPFSKVDW